MRPAALTLSLFLAVPSALAAQHPGDVSVGLRDAFATSAGAPFLASIPGAVTEEMDRLLPDLQPDRRARAGALVSRHFADSVLVAAVLERMAEGADPERVADLVAWLDDEDAVSFRERMESGGPTSTLDEFVQEMHVARPDDERVDAVLRFTSAQRAGTFYVLAETVVREAVYTILRALGEAPPNYVPRTDAQLMEQADRYALGALLTFLHRFDGVPTEVIDGVASGFETAAGQWWVDAYSGAVTAAIRAAAEAAAAEAAG